MDFIIFITKEWLLFQICNFRFVASINGIENIIYPGRLLEITLAREMLRTRPFPSMRSRNLVIDTERNLP